MNDFEEKAFLSGFNDNEDYLNHLCKNDNESSFYSNEDDEDDEESFSYDFPTTSIKSQLDEIAEIIIRDFYWKHESLNSIDFIYTLEDYVMLIAENKFKLIDLLNSLDSDRKSYFLSFEIETRIDAYYSSAKIKGELMDEKFRQFLLGT